MSSNTMTVASTDVATESKQTSLIRAMVIWGIVALFYFYDNLLQVSPSAMKPELTLAFTKDAEQFGSLSAYCLYAYGLMQIPAGVLLDKFGPRRIITLACALCVFGSLLFGFATTLIEAKIGRIFIGAGASFALLCCLKIVSIWFGRDRYALMTGLTVTVGYLGGAFGLAFVAKLVEYLGWRSTMFWGGVAGGFLCVLLWLLVKERHQFHTKKDLLSLDISEQTEEVLPSTTQKSHALSDLKYIVKNKQTWIAALFAGLMFVPTLALGGLWGIPFLHEAHGFDRATAGICVSLVYLGWVFGGSFWGFISDYFGRRNLPMFVGNIITLAICVAVIYFDHLPLYVLKTLFFGIGFFSSSFLIAFAVVAENNPVKLAATASGFANALNTLWGALAQPFIGLLLDLSKEQTVVEGSLTLSKEVVETGFTLAQYQSAFLTLPISLVISLLFLCFLKETYCGKK